MSKASKLLEEIKKKEETEQEKAERIKKQRKAWNGYPQNLRKKEPKVKEDVDYLDKLIPKEVISRPAPAKHKADFGRRPAMITGYEDLNMRELVDLIISLQKQPDKADELLKAQEERVRRIQGTNEPSTDSKKRFFMKRMYF